MSMNDHRRLSHQDLVKIWQPIINYNYNKDWFLIQAITTKEYSVDHNNSPHKEALGVLGKAIVETVIAEHAIKELNHAERGEIENYKVLSYNSLEEFGQLLLVNIRSKTRASNPDLITLFRLDTEEKEKIKREDLRFLGEFTYSLVGSVYLDSNFENAKDVARQLLLLDLNVFLKTLERVPPKELKAKITEAELRREKSFVKKFLNWYKRIIGIFKKKREESEGNPSSTI